jgi:hypothetical protein
MTPSYVYNLGCYDALIKLGAKLTPEQLADYRRQVALREARLPDVHIPGAELVQRPTSPAAMQMNQRMRHLLEEIPLVGGNTAEIQRQAAAREAELTRRLQATGRFHRSVPGTENIPTSPAVAAEGTVASSPSAKLRASQKTLPPLPSDIALAKTVPQSVSPGVTRSMTHSLARRVPSPGAAFARTLLRRFAHI